MSPKRDSPVNPKDERSPKHDTVLNNDGVIAPNAVAASAAESLGIPPLPRSRRDLFKIAQEMLPVTDKLESDTPAVPGIAEQDIKKSEPEDDLPRDVIGKYVNVPVRLIKNNGDRAFTFPLALRKVIDNKSGDFVKFTDFNSCIADLADAELVSRGFKAVFICPDTHFGSKLNLCIVASEYEDGEYLLNEDNFCDLIVSSYATHGQIVFKLYASSHLVKTNSSSTDQKFRPRLMKVDHDQTSRDRSDPRTPSEARNVVLMDEERKLDEMTDDEFFKADNVIRPEVHIDDLMKRARPPFEDESRIGSGMVKDEDNIMMNGHDQMHMHRPQFGNPPGVTCAHLQNSVPPVHSHNGQFSPRINKNMTPIRVYDDGECKVTNMDRIVPFARESIAERVRNLETSASVSLPRATDVAKLLKSHNIALKDEEDIGAWYQRFGEFGSMLGLYICPPNAMDKDSEMGTEWDAGGLPLAFYDKRVQSERILSLILNSPKFIPDKYKDELLLNPNPYNFLRLFITLYTCSASSLSLKVVLQPGRMKASQSLASYAYEWVQYFNNEANVNGMPYSKYRQYTYFVWGLHNRYAPIKKFLEQDFKPYHDRHNNIPISLELHNIPATIASLAIVHGISPTTSTTGHIQQLQDTSHEVDARASPQDANNDASVLLDSIRQVQSKGERHGKSQVQCWLCDGSHTFRECGELKRLHAVCAKRPTLSKYVSKMVLAKHDDSAKKMSIRALIEVYDSDDIKDGFTNKAQEDNSIQALIDALDAVPKGTDDADPGKDKECVNAVIDDNDSVNNADADRDDDDGGCYITHSDFFSSDVFTDESFDFECDTIGALVASSDDDDDDAVDAPKICSIDAHRLPGVKFDTHHRAQVDSAADRTTTPFRELIHDFRLPDASKGDRLTIGDAGVHSHPILGYGYFHVNATNMKTGEDIVLRAPCMYIPSIPSTLMNFLDIPQCLVTGELVDVPNNIAYRLVELKGYNDEVVRCRIPLIRVNTRLYTADRLIESSTPSSNDIHYDVYGSVIQKIISDEPTRLLWHSRFGHLNFRSLSSLHRSVIGLPIIKDAHSSDNCPSCLECKLRHSAKGDGSLIEKATSYGQVLSADWGFVCTQSEDVRRFQRLQSVYGESSYLLITCAYSGAIFGVCGSSKAVPHEWLNTFFYRISHSLHHVNKSILVDRGSELGRSQDFTDLVQQYHYKLHTCGPDKSSMNGLGERPHSTIGDAIRTMLYSAGLPPKYWNFAFHHFIRLYNMYPHGDRKLSPFEIIHGRKPDVSKLRVFGCRVYVRPPGRRPSKLDRHVTKGIFLGYTATMKQIYYLECSTGKIKIASHVRFDEGMNDLPLDELPPFAVHLRRALGHGIPPDAADIDAPHDLNIFCSDELFPHTFDHRFRILSSDITDENDTLGFILSSSDASSRPHISDIVLKSTATQYPRWRSTLIGAYILSVDGTPVTTKHDVEAALSASLVASSGTSDSYVTISFAVDKSYRKEVMHSMTNSGLQSDQLCRIASVVHDLPNPSTSIPSNDVKDSGESVSDLPVLDEFFADYLDQLLTSPSLLAHVDGPSIKQLLTTAPRLTRRILMGRADWPEWKAAEYKQLDAHHAHKTFGKPMIRPKICTALRAVWNYVLKWNNEKKARICCDGRPLALRGTKLVQAIYTACVSQTGMKLFIALSALLGYYIYDLDAVNAYAQGGEPYDECYLMVDDQYREWYKSRFDVVIPPNHVVPILCPLQGHPDAGEVWQTKVNSVLLSFGLKPTTHEPCLYRGTYKGTDILLCRQVDDMLIAGRDQSVLKDFASAIGQQLNVTISDGPSLHYNGLDIEQTREGIKIHCSTYLAKLASAHGWDTTSSKPMEPIHPDAVKELESTTGPPIDSPEGKALADAQGFNYRAIVGEIVYAYILCRPDFGFAVTLLSRFNTCPAPCHYAAAKRCLKSLLRTSSDGIWYWRRAPLQDLPPTVHVPRPLEDFELDFPILNDPFLASATVDASFGPNLHCRRSIGASFIYLGLLYLVSYVGKLQPFTTDSSCASEFVQYVHTGKRLKYVRSILIELGIPQNGPSPIYGDNMAAIMMANNTRPTERTRHLDIRWFAIQEWIHVDCDIILLHIPGILNPSDSQTKALAYRLHHRHMSRAMGWLGSPFLSGMFKLVTRDGSSIKVLYLVSS